MLVDTPRLHRSTVRPSTRWPWAIRRRDPLPAGPWDAIVSALAIHHLSDDMKRMLFARVHAELRPGGLFVNADQVSGPTPPFADQYATWHEVQARQAGFVDADCLFKHYCFAVFVARRAPAR